MAIFIFGGIAEFMFFLSWNRKRKYNYIRGTNVGCETASKMVACSWAGVIDSEGKE